MKKRRIVNRVLPWALGGSLALHALFAFEVHRIPVVKAKEPLPTHGDIIHLYIPATPPPTPKPVQTPHPAAQQNHQQRVLAVRPPHTRSNAPGSPLEHPVLPVPHGGPDGVVDVVASASPGPVVPTESPRPTCSNPNVPAKTVDPISPPVPDDAAGASGTAQVKVTLTASGGVEAVSIYRSTGNLMLDRAALRAAHASSYVAEQRDCLPVRGTYLFTVDFQS